MPAVHDGTVATINWERESGDRIEEFVTAALVLEHSGGCRITPSRGDGGIDVLLPFEDGTWHVVQVKRYSQPLDSKQMGAVERSFAAFQDEALLNVKVSKWSLAMPWDPTRERLVWLQALPKRDPDLVVAWMGRTPLDVLAAGNPRLVDYYFGDGEERLQTLMARALDAGQPVQGSGSDGLLTSAVRRIDDLAAVMEEIDPFYRYEIAMVTSIPPESEMSAHAEGAAMARFGTTESGQPFRLRVVPRSPLSAQFRPIKQTVRFSAQPGTSDFEALQLFRDYGKPFVGVAAEITHAEGPPGTTQTGPSILSLYVAEHEALPPMELVLSDATENILATLPLEPARGNLSVREDGFWMATTDRTGALKVELRSGGVERDITLSLSFQVPVGATAVHVADTARLGGLLVQGGSLLIRAVGGQPLVGPFVYQGGLGPSQVLWTVLERYSRLQAHTHDVVKIPDLRSVPESEHERFEVVINALDGQLLKRTWDRQFLMGKGAEWPTGEFAGVTVREIEMPLAGVEVALTAVLEQRFLSCRIDPDPDAELPAGCDCAIAPDKTDEMTLCARERRDDDEPDRFLMRDGAEEATAALDDV